MKKYLPHLIATLILFLPVIMFAGGPFESGTTIKNPLGDGKNEIKDLLTNIMNLVATVGAIVVVIFIIYSGFKFVTAGDSDSDRTKAKDMFYYTIIGGAILLGADIIANVVVNTVNTTVGRS